MLTFICHFVSKLDPIPDFDLSVNQSSKSITITVEPGQKVHARLCYQTNKFLCTAVPELDKITVSKSDTVIWIHAPCVQDCLYVISDRCWSGYYVSGESIHWSVFPTLVNTISQEDLEGVY